MKWIVMWLAALVSIVSGQASGADHSQVKDEAVLEAVRHDPEFMRALVDELKRDPEFLKVLLREAQQSKEDAIATGPATGSEAAQIQDAPPARVSRRFRTRDTDDHSPSPPAEALSEAMTVASPAAPAANAASQVQIDASTGGSTATISLAFPLSSKISGGMVEQHTFAIKASAPIDNKDQGSATFAGTGGLASGLTLGADWTLARMRDLLTTQTTPHGQDLLDQLCDRMGIVKPCSAQKVLPILESRNTDSSTWKLWDDYLSNEIGPMQIYNLHINGNHTQYKYFSDSPITAQTDSKIGWSVGGLAGFITSNQLNFLGAGFDFVRSYKEAKDAAECDTNSNTTPYLSCTLGKFAPPVNQIHRVVSLQSRNLLPITPSWQLPIGLTIAHDLVSVNGRHENSVDMPVYLLRDKDQILDGGLRFGWATSSHFSAGIFVGSEFSLSPISPK